MSNQIWSDNDNASQVVIAEGIVRGSCKVMAAVVICIYWKCTVISYRHLGKIEDSRWKSSIFFEQSTGTATAEVKDYEEFVSLLIG